jgi:DNA-binding response OmpR family regulator
MLADCLELEGMRVKLCPDGDAGLNAFRRDPFDVCLLDVMLPHKDGFTPARENRSLNKHTPILFLTARSLRRTSCWASRWRRRLHHQALR